MKNAEMRENILPMAVYLAAFMVLFGRTIYRMGVVWYSDPNYSHGFLIPVISAYLIWDRRDTLKNLAGSPAGYGLAVVLFGLLVFLLGNLAGEYYTMRFSMLIVLAGTIIYSCGMGCLRAVSFPFFFLIFMIPLPYIVYDQFAFPLKMMVSKMSVSFLSLIGVPVLREGNIISLAQITLEVADACSGIRSIISLLALAAALGYLSLRGVAKRLVLFILAVPIAVIANAVRVIGTGILANVYGPDAAEGFFHEFAGIIIFGVAFLFTILAAFILARIGEGGRGA